MSALLSIELDFHKLPDDFTSDQYDQLQKAMPNLFEGPQADWSRSWGGPTLIDEGDATLLSDVGLGFIVKRFKGQMKVTLPSSVGDVPDAQHVHIHVPNIGLFAIDEVTYIEDACTDALQDHLDKGWKILCVCPPNNQRRPDYILGRIKGDDR